MKILTWNTQGERWNSITQRIDIEEPDVFCIQEAGNLPKALNYNGNIEFKEVNRIGSYNGYNIWYVPWARSMNGNIRSSMAMLFKDNGKPSLAWSELDEKRPVMRKTIGNYYVSNIHAGGRDYINLAIQQTKIMAGDKKWAVAGDFNQDYQGAAFPWMDMQGGHIIAPKQPTRPQSGTILDYAVSTIQGGVASMPFPYYPGSSDHRCVMIAWY